MKDVLYCTERIHLRTIYSTHLGIYDSIQKPKPKNFYPDVELLSENYYRKAFLTAFDLPGISSLPLHHDVNISGNECSYSESASLYG